MTPISRLRTLRFALYAVAVAVMLTGMSTPATAQDLYDDEWFYMYSGEEWETIEGYSAILSNTNQYSIYTYVETDTNYDLLGQGWDPYVVGSLYMSNGGNPGLINQTTNFGSFSLLAAANMANSVVVGQQYFLEGDHYVYYTDDGCSPQFLSNCNYNSDVFYAGSSFVELDAGAPNITSINPNSALLGSTGTMDILGGDLIDPFSANVSLSFSGSGITFSSDQIYDPGSISVNYSIAGNATTGTQNLTLSNRFGSSNAVPFTVYDPGPVITGVATSPDPTCLHAGVANQTVTISGSNFGTNPSVAFGDANIVIVGTPAVSQAFLTGGGLAPTQTITVQVTVGAQDLGGTPSVTVTSGGYGFGFTTPPPGGTLSATSQVPVSAYVPPVATIQYFGQPITGTQNVYVGQLMSLTGGGVTLPPGLYITSYNWGIPGTTIASLLTPTTTPPSTSGETPTPLPLAVTSQMASFYWIYTGGSSPATYNVSYSYCINNGQCSPQSNATFSVAAPTGVSLSTQTGAVAVFNQSSPRLGLAGSPALPQGISLLAQATGQDGDGHNVAASGSYQWFQLLNNVVTQYLDGTNPYVHACTSFANDPQATSGACGVPSKPACAAELDGAYPSPSMLTTYVDNDGVVDSPYAALLSTDGERQRTMDATTYLQWTPAVAGQCNPNNYVCTIPVPVGSIAWFWMGDAIDTLTYQQGTGNNFVNNTNGNCGTCSQGQNVQGATYPLNFQTANPHSTNNYSYPQWQNTIPIINTCQKVY